ncbi:exo-beta-N-acetylmuramidase NamZ family protein [Actinoplanes sp. CA-142083]|uniref:exo-beta-N-acetylmuramidase NamZ family protein n=1 Tax=Actinoplanes sp. CA-142083 TaxID=3239903 RepID=UPI003D89D180
MPVDRRGLLAGAVGGAAGAALGPRAATAGGRARVRTGVERLIASRYAILRGERAGVITNPTGILPDLRHEVDVMHADPAVDLAAVFGPEHGFRGTAQAGGSQGFYDDPRTGLPVYDTYGKSGRALADVFTASGVGTVLFDIQDVGARFYTYIWTLYDSMVAAAMAGKRMVVLDRPNAISGRRASGPVLHPEYGTFVGRKPIAQAHGMTAGELARLFNAEWVPADAGRPAALTVVRLEGWSRDMYYEDTGLPWVPPSPNMPTVDTAVVYPGTCLFEGTQASEGRGSTRPFELIGAPYGDWRWADALTALRLPGAAFRESYFTPTFSKFAGQTVGGVQVVVTDRHAFDPIRTAIAMLVTLKRLYPAGFAWRPDNWIDTLTGSAQVRTSIDLGLDHDAVAAGWQGELAAFAALRARHLIYGSGR